MERVVSPTALVGIDKSGENSMEEKRLFTQRPRRFVQLVFEAKSAIRACLKCKELFRTFTSSWWGVRTNV